MEEELKGKGAGEAICSYCDYVGRRWVFCVQCGVSIICWECDEEYARECMACYEGSWDC